MPSSQKVCQRFAKRVSDLTKRFSDSIIRFEKAERFTGPSLYFHRKAIQRRRSFDNMSALLDDAEFLDLLYATLTAWGMHRMGPGNTKLLPLESIRDSLKSQVVALETLARSSIGGGPESEAPALARNIWKIINSIKVSPADAQIVANSKTLHHLLPDLVPPIDREYTFRFFYDRNTLSIEESAAFEEMYVEFDRIARLCSGDIAHQLGRNWHTGVAKVVDNAVVGYVIGRKETAQSWT